jgi:hypothetical protein
MADAVRITGTTEAAVEYGVATGGTYSFSNDQLLHVDCPDTADKTYQFLVLFLCSSLGFQKLS